MNKISAGVVNNWPLLGILLLSVLNGPALATQFSIESQSLSRALELLGAQSGVQIFSTSGLTKNKQSSVLDGDYATDQALTLLLNKTGLSYKKIAPQVFVITNAKKEKKRNLLLANYHYKLEEIVITSRKRSENIQSTPLSVAAFTETTLERFHVNELSDLSRIVPNLTIVPSPPISGNSAAAAVFIRGVGQLDFTTNVDPGVGIYLDGVYLARSVGSIIDELDLERIEVLRGPQGTLFGRNTIGGALRLISKEPEEQRASYFSLTIGSDQRIDTKAVFNMPLNTQWLSKISLLKRDRDGYVINGLGADLGNDDSSTIRSQLLWRATPALAAKVIIDVTKDRENGSPNTALNLFSTGVFPTRINTAPQGEAQVAGCNSNLLNTSRVCFGPAWLSDDNRRTESTFAAKSNNDILGASLTVDYDTGATSLKSISAWRELESNFQRDSDHTPFNLFATVNLQEQTQFSQEFQLKGVNNEKTLIWVGGVFYLNEKTNEFTKVFLPDETGVPINGLFEHYSKNSNRAIYGETSYDINQRLQLTIGSRYTVEEKFYKTYQRLTAQDNPEHVIVQLVDDPGHVQQFKELTSRLTLSYDLAPRMMIYTTFSQGFKSGGFNSRHLAATENLRAITYDPEYVTQYESGVKFYNQNHTLRVNSAIFYSDYDDIQISTNPAFTNGATITQNAAEASISGLELELSVVPNQAWLFETGIGYLDASYKTLDSQVNIKKSNDFVWMPTWSGTLMMTYNRQLANGLLLAPQMMVSYQSQTQGTAENEADARQGGYTLVDFSVMVKRVNSQWSLSLGVSNMADRDYLVSANQNQAIGYAEGVFARGRQWWLEVENKF